jgi:hypothetical protein
VHDVGALPPDEGEELPEGHHVVPPTDLAAELRHHHRPDVQLTREVQQVALGRRLRALDQNRLVARRAEPRAEEDDVESGTADVEASDDADDLHAAAR